MLVNYLSCLRTLRMHSVLTKSILHDICSDPSPKQHLSLGFFSVIVHWVYSVLTLWAWVRTTYWAWVADQGQHPWRKVILHPPHSVVTDCSSVGVDCMLTSLFHVGILSALTLPRSWANHLSCSEFTCTAALWCLETSISEQCSTASGFYIFSALFSEMTSGPWEERLWYGCSI